MKNIKKIGMLVLSFILIFTVVNISEVKAVTTTLSASSATVNSGESFSVTISSSLKLSGWTISLTNNGGCTLVSASGGELKDSSTVCGTALNGSTTLATYKFKAPTVNKDTKYTITFTGTDMCDNTDELNIVNNTSCSATITVKAPKSSGNSNNGSTSGNSGSNSGTSTTTKPKTPTFKSANKTVYTTGDVNLRSSWSTSSSATLVAKDTELKLTGTSTEKIDGYTWYRVTYKGQTKYIASSLITYTKPAESKDNKDDKKDENKNDKSSNKNLSSLSIEGIELTPKFNKETTQYTAEVDGDVSELKINTKVEDTKSKVVVEGNKDLKEGDNVIKVKVTAEDETTRTYFITVTKGEGTVTDTSLKLSELNISRVNFEGEFKPDTYTYELSLNTYVKNLDITAVPNQEDAKVEITGNTEFKAGTNMVTILLTSADGEQTATYQIQVNLPEEIVEEAEEPNMMIYIISGIAIAVVIIGIIIFIVRRRAARDDEYYDEEYDDNEEQESTLNEEHEMNQDEEDENKEVEERVRPSRRKKSDVTLDDFLNTDDDSEEKTKKTRGRHSI